MIARVQDDCPPHGVDPSDWNAWQAHFQDYLEQFGYSIYNLDFASPLPMDEPVPLLETIKLFLSGQGKNPSDRMQSLANRREAAVQAVQARVKGLKAWAFKKTLGWAQRFGPLREDSIAEIGLGYPVIHKLLGELGQRFIQAGILSNAGDIYWLEYSEVAQAVAALERGEACQELTGLVQPRKATWNMLKRAAPPLHLPAKAKILGMNLDAFLGVSSKQREGNTIHGFAASPGKVTATARVLTGPQDFDQMQPGDVLVAAITTPAWTPLFVMASAVVTDVGGPLSHGSIVAREYAIPAVLGTGVATRLIRSGQVVTVDGTAGCVTLSMGE
jgi:pyruvate,water dikinase